MTPALSPLGDGARGEKIYAWIKLKGDQTAAYEGRVLGHTSLSWMTYTSM